MNEIDLKLLASVSLEMAKYVKRLKDGRVARKRGELLSVFNAPDEGVNMNAEDVDTIAAKLCDLVRENERLKSDNSSPTPCLKCGRKRKWKVHENGGVASCPKCGEAKAGRR